MTERSCRLRFWQNDGKYTSLKYNSWPRNIRDFLLGVHSYKHELQHFFFIWRKVPFHTLWTSEAGSLLVGGIDSSENFLRTDSKMRTEVFGLTRIEPSKINTIQRKLTSNFRHICLHHTKKLTPSFSEYHHEPCRALTIEENIRCT